MDETQTNWFRWIARNAHHLFAIVWGMGLGAFGAVIFRLVDSGGDGVRIYIAVLTLLMAGTLGLISSRSMDHYSDRRKTRRKIFNLLVRMRSLSREMSGLTNECIRINPNRRQTLAEVEPLLPSNEVVTVLLRCERVLMAAQSLPDFDEVVETEEEARFAEIVLSRFAFAAGLFKFDNLADDELKLKAVGMVASIDDQHSRHLDDAITHYEARLRRDG